MRHFNRSTAAITRATLIALTILSTNGCMMFMRAPSDLDYSRTRVSEAGKYRATIIPAGDSVARNKLHSWTLHLETATGEPVDNAAVAVDGGMPQHGHGLPTKPVVTRHLGQGNHLVEGMKFNMGGWWVVKFSVGGAAAADTIVFNLKL